MSLFSMMFVILAYLSGVTSIRIGAPVKAHTCTQLLNNASFFSVQVELGTPPQQLALIVDTGSAPIVVTSCACTSEHQCAEGTCFDRNKSSSFVSTTDSLTSLYYGSGAITCKLASERVRVAEYETQAEDDITLAMDLRELRFEGTFEGIMGLGTPNGKEKRQLFTTMANVDRFGVCFNLGDGAQGALHLNNPLGKAPRLHSIGKLHWSLELQSVSIGKVEASTVSHRGVATSRVPVCAPVGKNENYTFACAAIFDSGTTFILAPERETEALQNSLCAQWPRCSALVPKHGNGAFHHVLQRCGSWLGESRGLNEVPSLFFHVAGQNGEEQLLELPPWTWIYESQGACYIGIEAFTHESEQSKNVWILGSAVYYSYFVSFDLGRESLSFTREPCRRCGDEDHTWKESKLVSTSTMYPRRMHLAKPRYPSYSASNFVF